jgi:hypothetical protein
MWLIKQIIIIIIIIMFFLMCLPQENDDSSVYTIGIPFCQEERKQTHYVWPDLVTQIFVVKINVWSDLSTRRAQEFDETHIHKIS